MFFAIAGEIIAWLVLAALVGGLTTWVFVREHKPVHKLNITVVSTEAIWDTVKSENFKISHMGKACNDLHQTAIIVENIGRKDIKINKKQGAQYAKIVLGEGVKILASEFTQVSSGIINPRVADDKEYSEGEKQVLMVLFDALNKGDAFKLIVLHDKASGFSVEAEVLEHTVKIKGYLKHGGEPSIKGEGTMWGRKRSLVVATIFAVIMFFVGYSGFILLFEEALFAAVPSFFAAYFGMEFLSYRFTRRK